jgi:hypothetical protein
MVSAIRISDGKIDMIEETTDIVSESTGTRLRQSEFLELLLDSDPKEIAGIIVRNMRKKMDKVK